MTTGRINQVTTFQNHKDCGYCYSYKYFHSRSFHFLWLDQTTKEHPNTSLSQRSAEAY